jgi:hypothetical protein
MKINFTSLFICLGLFTFSAKSQFVWQDSFTGQSNFGNPTGWDNLDGFTNFNVYQTHGNPTFGLTHTFGPSTLKDSISTPAFYPALNSVFEFDFRAMEGGALYPSSAQVLPNNASLVLRITDVFSWAELIRIDNTNQNSGVQWRHYSIPVPLQYVATQVSIHITAFGGTGAGLDYFMDFDNFTVSDGSTGIKTPINRSFSIAPNPASDRVFIAGLSGKGVCTLADMTGKTVLTQEFAALESETLNISGIAAGIYTLNVNQGGNLTHQLLEVRN